MQLFLSQTPTEAGALRPCPPRPEGMRVGPAGLATAGLEDDPRTWVIPTPPHLTFVVRGLGLVGAQCTPNSTTSSLSPRAQPVPLRRPDSGLSPKQASPRPTHEGSSLV